MSERELSLQDFLQLASSGCDSVPVSDYDELEEPDEPKFLPEISTSKELSEISPKTYRALTTASYLTQSLPGSFLIGGLAVAAHVGHVYRETDDVDIAINSDTFNGLSINLINHEYSGGNIVSGYINPDNLSEIFELDENPTLSQTYDRSNQELIQVDFFLCDYKGLPTVFGNRGKTSHIRLPENFDGIETNLLDIPLIVADRNTLLELKVRDNRPKGVYDYHLLQTAFR